MSHSKYHFNDPATQAPILGVSATLIQAIRSSEDEGSESLIIEAQGNSKNSALFQGFSTHGTGIYADQEFKRRDVLRFKFNFHAPLEDFEAQCDIQVLWTRSQDNDSVTAMCIRQMVFDTYEKMDVKLDEKLLNRLYNQSRESTADLIKIFGVSDPRNRLELEGIIAEYWGEHPSTAYRYGAKIAQGSEESWRMVLDKFSAALEQGRLEAQKSENKKLKRRTAHR